MRIDEARTQEQKARVAAALSEDAKRIFGVPEPLTQAEAESLKKVAESMGVRVSSSDVDGLSDAALGLFGK